MWFIWMQLQFKSFQSNDREVNSASCASSKKKTFLHYVGGISAVVSELLLEKSFLIPLTISVFIYATFPPNMSSPALQKPNLPKRKKNVFAFLFLSTKPPTHYILSSLSFYGYHDLGSIHQIRNILVWLVFSMAPYYNVYPPVSYTNVANMKMIDI